MQKITLGLAAIVLAGFVASDAMAERPHAGPGLSHGAHITTVAHRGHASHGRYHSSRHSSYYRPGYSRSHHGHHGYHRYHTYHGYRPPVIVTPPACGYPPVHRVYPPFYPPVNSFYYRGRNFGIGISF
jgi:hypothetical protein